MERKSVLTIQTPRKKHSVCLATGQNLRDVLHQLGLHGLSFPCGGNGICGKCIVHVDDAGSCPPTEADAIAGTEKPTLSSASKNQDLSLTTWTTTTVTEGDMIIFNIESATTVTAVFVELHVTAST